MAAAKTVECLETFHTAGKHGMVTYRKGNVLKASDPVVKANPNFFGRIMETEEVVHRAVESATAAPGETRTVTKPV